MSENYGNLEAAITTQLAKRAGGQAITPELIRTLINQHRQIDFYYVDDHRAEQLAKTIETRLDVSMTLGSVLKEDYEPWLEEARLNTDPYYWERYRQLLISKKLSPQVIASLDQVTDRILGLMENPARLGSWDRRGMVLGHVQSGKTSNYIGLMTKAADAGYKVIVVIAGIHNNLRNQTQLRIDEGFVGRDSSRLLSKKEDLFVGVGNFDRNRRPFTFTNSVADFNKRLATGVGIPLQSITEPAVFVIKKNATTLKNLVEWLREHSARGGSDRADIPMLLIDDEADNASINVAQGADAVSRINSRIRELLTMFNRSCYVGYTATPFANIFIDPETDHEMLGQDLFPRHFIVSLDPPSNYFGASRVFLSESDRVIRHIEDSEDWLPLKHPIHTLVAGLPPSLLDAIRAFVLTRAIRIARGQENEHSSMLVNVSRFTGVQKQVRNEIHHALTQIQTSARVFSGLSVTEALQNFELSALYAVWEREYCDTEVSWEEIQRILPRAASPIRVVEVNSSSSDGLNYADYPGGLSVIAVGGFSLSRGLTLEGLTISYFLRNSVMYDTLMQMGRWFGYRPGYDDLCRIWMLEEAQGWYEHITESIEMLRDELRVMEAAGATPEDFGLKVRAHPDTLIVTARNKMRSTEKVVVQVGLGNSFIETARLRRDPESLEANRLAAQRLVRRLRERGHPLDRAPQINRGYFLKQVPVEPVIDFLMEFQNHSSSFLTESGPVVQYIDERRSTELAEWDVLFTSLGDKDHRSLTPTDTTLGVPIICQRRQPGNSSNSDLLLITNKQRVASRGVEQVGLEPDQVEAAKRAYRDDPENQGRFKTAKTISYPDHIFRSRRERPLLIVHLVAIGEEGDDLRESKPVVAWSISFPGTRLKEARVEFIAGSVWLRDYYGSDYVEDEMSGDER
jgi:hypothetical protein